MSNDNDRRRPRSGNRPQGAGRRVYPDAAGGAPRVGRIARDVPRARRVGIDPAPRALHAIAASAAVVVIGHGLTP